MKTTVGQLLINDSLPPELRDYARPLDKRGLHALLTRIYTERPKEYARVVQALNNVGQELATADGGSVSLDDLMLPPDLEEDRERVRKRVDQILDAGGRDREKRVVEFLATNQPAIEKKVYDQLAHADNEFANQARSGARGTPSSIRSLLYGDLLVADHRDRLIPVAILNSYADGLDPAEYWAASYGARKGLADTKFMVADAGAWAKQTAQAAHQVVVTGGHPRPGTGLSVEVDDRELPGYVLAAPAGGHGRGTLISPQVQRDLKRLGVKQVLVHSPIEALDADGGGLPRVGAGVRERGRLPDPGENVGILAAQALAEKLSQSTLSSKHTSGTVGSSKRTVGGFELINNLIQVPKTFRGAAPVAHVDGRISHVDPAEQGGTYVYVEGTRHYVPPDQQMLVKPGDLVEAGDRLTDAIPNPADVVRFKGIGEGRRQFARYFKQAFEDSGLPAHRRNVEVLARGLINHVRINEDEADGVAGFLPHDVVEYDALAAAYTPREGSRRMSPNLAAGKYLEEPTLHYSIGTRVSRSVVDHLTANKVPDVHVNDRPPPFHPEMRRALDVLSVSPDPLVRFGGSYQQKGLLESVHRGRSSSTPSKSPIPAMVVGNL